MFKQIKEKISQFKTEKGRQWLEDWHQRVIKHSQLDYESIYVDTQYGKTHVWAKNHEDKSKPALLFLPGYRTCSIYWDFNNTLAPFYKDYRIYLLDVVGQPSLSAGLSPDVKGDGYGYWIKEVLDELGLDKVVVSGASFGAQLIFKLAKIAPERIACAIGFNPVGIQFISFTPRAMWYNLLHVLFPTNKNIDLYMRKMALGSALEMDKEHHELMMEYQYYTIRNFKLGADYPYRYSDQELKALKAPFYLILCEDDRLIQQKKTAKRAKAVLPNLKEVVFLSKIGHGIEIASAAFEVFARILEEQKMALKM